MKIELNKVEHADFNLPEEAPEIPVHIYEERCHKAYSIADSDWLVIYGDREHFANLAYLTGFDPRFEEAVLLLGTGNRRILLVGNEGLGYSSIVKPKIDIILCQSFSLMGQDRSIAPCLFDILKEAGIQHGQKVAVIGWKYLEPEESTGEYPYFFVPSILVDNIRTLVGDPKAVLDATWILMHPSKGLRSHNEVEQIAAFEWGASRATAAVSRIIHNIQPGMTEFQAVSNMNYGGDPLSIHVVFASGHNMINGLRSPTAKRIKMGDGAVTGVGFWGGLAARAGLIENENEDFISRVAIPYFRGLAAWYQAIGIGVSGKEIFEHVSEALAQGGLRSKLNPGHLSSLEEWLHSPIRLDGLEKMESGMFFQCDIIPEPMLQDIL